MGGAQPVQGTSWWLTVGGDAAGPASITWNRLHHTTNPICDTIPHSFRLGRLELPHYLVDVTPRNFELADLSAAPQDSLLPSRWPIADLSRGFHTFLRKNKYSLVRKVMISQIL